MSWLIRPTEINIIRTIFIYNKISATSQRNYNGKRKKIKKRKENYTGRQQNKAINKSINNGY